MTDQLLVFSLNDWLHAQRQRRTKKRQQTSKEKTTKNKKQSSIKLNFALTTRPPRRFRAVGWIRTNATNCKRFFFSFGFAVRGLDCRGPKHLPNSSRSDLQQIHNLLSWANIQQFLVFYVFRSRGYLRKYSSYGFAQIRSGQSVLTHTSAVFLIPYFRIQNCLWCFSIVLIT